MTALYSILHFLVDGVCAFVMFGYFATQENWYVNVLLYNFCAFAMQMPLGVVLDGLCGKAGGQACKEKYSPSFGFAVLGVILTLMGAFTHPVVLGLGNALFHLGGGVGTIHEDEAKGWKGRGLGVFVAPGALGLYIGTQLIKNNSMDFGWTWVVCAGMVMLLCLGWSALILRRKPRMQGTCERYSDVRQEKTKSDGIQAKADIGLLSGCLLVVILRSYIGMAISFSWKNTLLAGTIAVLAVVLGKVAGGFAAVGFGLRRTVMLSLGLAAVGYLFSGNMMFGVVALFLFNMTMPITLYLLVKRLKDLPGFAFGLLTFGLFLGFLPVYLKVNIPMGSPLTGCLGSLISLVILWWCVERKAG